jgi:hypothetical protein
MKERWEHQFPTKNARLLSAHKVVQIKIPALTFIYHVFTLARTGKRSSLAYVTAI